MGKDPAFMLYSQDFLVGVSDLTMEERGQYITMLCLQHQKGRLSAKNIQIAVGTVSQDVLDKFIQDENGLYYNETLEGIMAKRTAYCQSRSENGKKGGRPQKKEAQKNHMETICLPYENHTENVIENINEYNNIFEYWNTKDILKHKTLTIDISNAIEKALSIYKPEAIKEYIDRYATVLNDSAYYWSHRWSLADFLTRPNGIPNFTDEGNAWVNYCKQRKGEKDAEIERNRRWAEIKGCVDL